MCDKKLLRARNSRCAVGLQRVNICASLRLGYACSGCRIVSIQETLVEKGPEHAEHNCTLSALCAYGPGDEEPQIVDIGSKVPLVSIGEPSHWYSPSDRVVEPPAPMYVSVNKPVTAIDGIQWGNKVLNVDQLVAHTWEIACKNGATPSGALDTSASPGEASVTPDPSTAEPSAAGPATRGRAAWNLASPYPTTPNPVCPWLETVVPAIPGPTSTISATANRKSTDRAKPGPAWTRRDTPILEAMESEMWIPNRTGLPTTGPATICPAMLSLESPDLDMSDSDVSDEENPGLATTAVPSPAPATTGPATPLPGTPRQTVAFWEIPESELYDPETPNLDISDSEKTGPRAASQPMTAPKMPGSNMNGPELSEASKLGMTEANSSDLNFSGPKTTDHKPAGPAGRHPGMLRPVTRRPDTPRPDIPWPDPLLPQTTWPHMPHPGTPWPHLTGGKTLPGRGVIRPGMAAAVVMTPAATAPKEETAPKETAPEAKTTDTTTSTRRELSDEELADLLQSELAGMEREERLPPLNAETPSVENSELSELPRTEMSELEAMFGEEAMDLDMDGTGDDEDEEEDWDDFASDLSVLDAMFGRDAMDHEMNDADEGEEGGDWDDSDSEMSDAPTVYVEVSDDPGTEVLPSIETAEQAQQQPEVPERFFNWPAPNLVRTRPRESHSEEEPTFEDYMAQAGARRRPYVPPPPRAAEEARVSPAKERRVADELGTTFLEAALWPRTLDGVNIYDDL